MSGSGTRIGPNRVMALVYDEEAPPDMDCFLSREHGNYQQTSESFNQTLYFDHLSILLKQNDLIEGLFLRQHNIGGFGVVRSKTLVMLLGRSGTIPPSGTGLWVRSYISGVLQPACAASEHGEWLGEEYGMSCQRTLA